jgi:hypothetical protein
MVSAKADGGLMQLTADYWCCSQALKIWCNNQSVGCSGRAIGSAEEIPKVRQSSSQFRPHFLKNMPLIVAMLASLSLHAHRFQFSTIQPLTQLWHRSAMHHSTTLHLTKPPGQQWEPSIKNLSDHKAHFANQSHPPDHLATKHEVLSSHQILQHNNQPAGACNLSSKERSQVSCVMNIFDSFD